MDRKVRRHEREMALQALYAMRVGGGELERCVDFVVSESDRPPVEDSRDYCVKLLTEVVARQEWADQLIASKLQHWDLDRVTFIDRLILELALIEMVNFDDVPPKVSISEAIEIAKIYSTADSPGFVNGILDAVYHDLLAGKSTDS